MIHNLAALGISPDMRPEVRIRMGRKKDRGYGVVDKGRFWLALSRADGSGKDARSVLHPAFSLFNNPNINPAWCRELRGNLIHAHWEAPERLATDGCVYSRFGAHRLPGHAQPPGQRPTCTGDGQRARRWDGDRFRDIECPGDRCEFRMEQPSSRGPVVHCKRTSTFVFQIRWEDGPCPECRGRMPAVASCEVCGRSGKVARDFPSVTAMIESGGTWSFTTMQWWGFYAHIKSQWTALGGQGEPNLYGLPVRLVLTKRTVPGRKAEVWVPEIQTDFPAGQTLQAWLRWKAQQLASIGHLLQGGTRLALPDNTLGARAAAEDAQDQDGGGYSLPAEE